MIKDTKIEDINREVKEEATVSFDDDSIIIEVGGEVTVYSKNHYNYYVPDNATLLRGETEFIGIHALSNGHLIRKYTNISVSNDRKARNLRWNVEALRK